MDGINPTLAFAALFFGLSGHPHDKAEDTVKEAEVEQLRSVDPQVWSAFECSGFAIARPGNDPWRDALTYEAKLTSLFPDAAGEVPATDDSFAHETPISLENSAPEVESIAAADTEILPVFPVETGSGSHDPGGCDALAPQP